MEASKAAGGCAAVKWSSERRPIKPSRKLFEQDCKRLENEIHILRQKLSDLRQSVTDLFAKLDKLKVERDKKFSDKTALESTIKTMSTEINKLSAKLGQLQSQIHYRDMRKLEDAIRKLQVHLDSHHFKLSEEKKIVAEIDKLNRSKKVVGEFLNVQAALKELRGGQHDKRAERDRCVKAFAALRRDEEAVRAEIEKNKTQERQLKADIDKTYDEKKALKADFTQKQQQYAQQKETLKEEAQRQQCYKQEQQRIPAMHITKCSTIFQQSQRCEPEHKHVLACQRLIDFCTKVSRDYGDEKSNKRQKKKSISYTPDVLSQFLSVGISPPITIQNAQTCIPVLHQKIASLRETRTRTLSEASPLSSSDVAETSPPSPSDVAQALPLNTPAAIEAPSLSTPDVAQVVKVATNLSNQSSTNTDTQESQQQPDDSSDISSDYSKQLSSSSDIDPIEQEKQITSILDSLVLGAEDSIGSCPEGQI